jgi:release factor glutamine methyltransferase
VVEKITISASLAWGKSYLKYKTIDTYHIDAEVLLRFILTMQKEKLYMSLNESISIEKYCLYKDAINKRSIGVPVQYITSSCEFMSLEFYINESVLIPRADTEVLVETVISHVHKFHTHSILDLCTGSGCIAISLSVNINKSISIIASDISIKALEVAKYNAKQLCKNNNVTFLQSDLFKDLDLDVKFDIIVSNPPYIADVEFYNLDRCVLYEPSLALYAADAGLYFYKSIISQAKNHLTLKGKIFLEIGYNQGGDIKSMLIQYGFKNISVIKDYSGHDRVIMASIG